MDVHVLISNAGSFHWDSDAAEVKSKMEEYTTAQLPYNQKKIDSLLKIAMDNMKNNKLNLMREMYNAAVRKHQQKRG